MEAGRDVAVRFYVRLDEKLDQCRAMIEGAMGEESSRTHDVFLSYSTKDKTWADSACAVLEQHRIRCWIAPRDMTPGDEWAAGIIKGLNASRLMVLIFSDHANASKQVRKEVERAISKDLPVLAFRIQNVEPKDAMEFNLSNIHWLDAFTPPVERNWSYSPRRSRSFSAKTQGRRPATGPPDSHREGLLGRVDDRPDWLPVRIDRVGSHHRRHSKRTKRGGRPRWPTLSFERGCETSIR